MPDYTSEALRNVALVGHGGVGKTLLAEAMLHKAGAIGAMGELARGTTVSDFDDQEKEHQHSLQSSLMSFAHDGCHVNLIDTPGYPDFLGRALSVLPAVETVAVVVDARSGVELSTRRMMEAASEHGLCRMLVVNKIDADDIDFDALMMSINEAFGDECLPINLPAPGGGAVVDVGEDAVYGRYVVIDHGEGTATLYGHASTTFVRLGQRVRERQVIALSGSTGRSTAPHLHFEVLVNGEPVDPLTFVEQPG